MAVYFLALTIVQLFEKIINNETIKIWFDKFILFNITIGVNFLTWS